MTEPEDDRDDGPTVTVETWVGAELTSRRVWRREDFRGEARR